MIRRYECPACGYVMQGEHDPSVNAGGFDVITPDGGQPTFTQCPTDGRPLVRRAA